MPTCDPRYLTKVCQTIINLQPKSILDLGIGLGKWGHLSREYTDIWRGLLTQQEWQTYIEGIEIWDEYNMPTYGMYNNILMGSIESFLPRLDPKGETFDLVIMVDVLEHFEKSAGLEILTKIVQSGKKALISYANCFQGEWHGNPHEEHKSSWTASVDFTGFTYEVIESVPDESWGLYLFTDISS
jgi:hypothetical protein